MIISLWHQKNSRMMSLLQRSPFGIRRFLSKSRCTGFHTAEQSCFSSVLSRLSRFLDSALAGFKKSERRCFAPRNDFFRSLLLLIFRITCSLKEIQQFSELFIFNLTCSVFGQHFTRINKEYCGYYTYFIQLPHVSYRIEQYRY